MMNGNARSGDGGAIKLQNGGRATVRDSRFINNRANVGGAAFIGWVGTDSSWLTVSDSSFVDNRASNSGGAIYAGSGTVTVSNSSFTNNSAAGPFYGGAVRMVNPFTRLDVVNSSFINNSSGVLSMVGGATANLTHVTIAAENEYMLALQTEEDPFTSAGAFTLRNSIVVGSMSSAVCDNLKQNISNLVKDASCSPKLSGDPMLAEATDSSTHLELLPGSPGYKLGRRALLPRERPDGAGRARLSVAAISARLKLCRLARPCPSAP